MLTDPQIERYSRQLLLPEMTGRSQFTLLDSRVLVQGAGLAARTAVDYLSGAGVGQIDVSVGSWTTDNPDTLLTRAPTSLEQALKQVDAAVITAATLPEEINQMLVATAPSWLAASTSEGRVVGPLSALSGSQVCRTCLDPMLHATTLRRDNPLDIFVGALASLGVLRGLLGLVGATSSSIVDARSGQWTTAPLEGYRSCRIHRGAPDTRRRARP